MKKVRIVNEGQPSYMTKVTDVETGEQLERVVSVELKIDVSDKIPTATLATIFPVVDVIADAEIRHVCPYCGRPTEEKPNKLQSLIDAVKAWEDEQMKAQY